ncbi:MAG: hypothetical protein KKD39_03615, partial [Candidatus Altiarchaeota archaeon]|nr:hypothetical protein [Candidatus Altiarchaeota archaeon]
QAKLNAIGDDARAEGEKLAQDILAQGQRKALIHKQKMLGEEANKRMTELTAQKAKAVGEAISEAKAKIISLPDEAKSKMLSQLASDAQAIASEKKIKVDPKYAKLFKGVEGSEVVVEDIGDFGVVIESKDGLMKIDNRLSAVLESKAQSIKPKINKILFEE